MPCWPSAYQHKRNDIHIKTGSTLHDSIRTNAAKLMCHHGTTNKHIIAHLNKTTYSHIISKNSVIADRTIMSDMAVIHKETTTTDMCFCVFFRSSMSGKAFSKDIIITHHQPRLGFGLKASILRQAAQNCMGM